MRKFKNKWGIVDGYNALNDETGIHSEDLDYFKQLSDISVFQCIDEDLDYIILKEDVLDIIVEKIRIKSNYFIIKKEPCYKVGDKIRPKNHPDKTGFIRLIGWHYKNNDYNYYINLEGKKKKTRYWENDLEKI